MRLSEVLTGATPGAANRQPASVIVFLLGGAKSRLAATRCQLAGLEVACRQPLAGVRVVDFAEAEDVEPSYETARHEQVTVGQ